MISNNTTTKVIKQEKGYRVVIGGLVCRKHCLTRGDATRYIHRVQQGLARMESDGVEILKENGYV